MDVVELDVEPGGHGNPGVLDQVSMRVYPHGQAFLTTDVSHDATHKHALT
jgi:hypothetical protein